MRTKITWNGAINDGVCALSRMSKIGVVPRSKSERQKSRKSAGHGRNGASEFTGARQVKIAHQKLNQGDRCPECGRCHVYEQKKPKVLVRIVGQAPLAELARGGSSRNVVLRVET